MCQEIPGAIQLSPNVSLNACSIPQGPYGCYNELEGPVQRPNIEASLTQGNTWSSSLKSWILARNQKHNGTNSHLLLHWSRHFTCCLQYKTDVTRTFFCQQSYQPSFDIYWCWCRKYKQPTEIFPSQTQFTAQASKLTKTLFPSLWQIQLPPDIWYFSSPMISAFSIGGHRVPQSKSLILSTNVRSAGWAAVFLDIFWLYQYSQYNIYTLSTRTETTVGLILRIKK